MNKKCHYYPFLASLMLLLVSCGSSKDIPYFKNRETVNQNAKGYLVDARIMPKDMLTITVSTTTPAAAQPFNLVTPTSQTALQTYLVDNDGKINMIHSNAYKIALTIRARSP